MKKWFFPCGKEPLLQAAATIVFWKGHTVSNCLAINNLLCFEIDANTVYFFPILFFLKNNLKNCCHFILYFTLATWQKRSDKVYFLVGFLNCSLLYLRLKIWNRVSRLPLDEELWGKNSQYRYYLLFLVPDSPGWFLPRDHSCCFFLFSLQLSVLWWLVNKTQNKGIRTKWMLLKVDSNLTGNWSAWLPSSVEDCSSVIAIISAGQCTCT